MRKEKQTTKDRQTTQLLLIYMFVLFKFKYYYYIIPLIFGCRKMLVYNKINKNKFFQVSRKWEKKRGKCQESGRNKSQVSRKWEKKRGKCQESGRKIK